MVLSSSSYSTPSSQSIYDPTLSQQNNEAARQSALSAQQYNQGLGATQQKFNLGTQRINQFLPYLNAYGNPGSAPGGTNTPTPGITVGGVYSPDQLQQQVNLTRAQGDQSGASQIHQQQAALAGRGMSTNSPMMQALANQTNAATNATNASNETNLRFNAAQANAQQQTASEALRNTQWQQQNQLDVARRTQQAQQMNYLLQAMVGLGNI